MCYAVCVARRVFGYNACTNLFNRSHPVEHNVFIINVRVEMLVDTSFLTKCFVAVVVAL